NVVSLLFLCVLLISLSDRAFGDEGMWLYTAPPTKQLKEKYNFEPSKQWLDHLQKSSVRFSSGGSGSFISADGLVITNHHVGADALQKFSAEQHIAFYGGDPDNFEYPRFDLDICIFRAYENGQPAKIDNYLKFSAHGPADGELTFVSGHPAKTDRQLTLDELADMRDRELPRF